MTMRHVGDPSQFTPLGMWIRQYCKGSARVDGQGLSVTNLDFVIEDFRGKKIQLLEEKQNMGRVEYAQAQTFKVLDTALSIASVDMGYEYWGLFVLRMPGTMPGPGMLLNGVPITSEQLRDHLNFDRRHCEPVYSRAPAHRGQFQE